MLEFHFFFEIRMQIKYFISLLFMIRPPRKKKNPRSDILGDYKEIKYVKAVRTAATAICNLQLNSTF